MRIATGKTRPFPLKVLKRQGNEESTQVLFKNCKKEESTSRLQRLTYSTLNKRFKKEDRVRFIQHFNKDHLEEILHLAKILSDNEDLLQAKFVDVDRGGINLHAIERNGEIHQLRVAFRSKIYDIDQAEKATLELLGDLAGR